VGGDGELNCKPIPPGYSKNGANDSLSLEPSPLHPDPPNHAITSTVAKSKPNWSSASCFDSICFLRSHEFKERITRDNRCTIVRTHLCYDATMTCRNMEEHFLYFDDTANVFCSRG
jgi:hypothetical protein